MDRTLRLGRVSEGVSWGVVIAAGRRQWRLSVRVELHGWADDEHASSPVVGCALNPRFVRPEEVFRAIQYAIFTN